MAEQENTKLSEGNKYVSDNQNCEYRYCHMPFCLQGHNTWPQSGLDLQQWLQPSGLAEKIQNFLHSWVLPWTPSLATGQFSGEKLQGVTLLPFSQIVGVIADRLEGVGSQ